MAKHTRWRILLLTTTFNFKSTHLPIMLYDLMLLQLLFLLVVSSLNPKTWSNDCTAASCSIFAHALNNKLRCDRSWCPKRAYTHHIEFRRLTFTGTTRRKEINSENLLSSHRGYVSYSNWGVAMLSSSRHNHKWHH